METHKEITDFRNTVENTGRVSWTAIFAGTLVMLIVLMLLSLLGVGIGFASVNPAREVDPMQGLGTGALIWWVISNLAAVFTGAYVAAHLTNLSYKLSGVYHGLLTWCLFTLISFWLMTTAVGGIISGVGGVVSKSLSAVGMGISGVSSMADQANPDRIKSMIQEAISQKPGDTAKFDINVAGVVQDVFFVNGKFRSDVQRQEIEQSIAKNSTLSQSDVQRATDVVLQQYEQAKQKWQELKPKIEEGAQKATDTLGKAAIWAFVSLLLNAIIAALGGKAGEPLFVEDQYRRRTDYKSSDLK